MTVYLELATAVVCVVVLSLLLLTVYGCIVLARTLIDLAGVVDSMLEDDPPDDPADLPEPEPAQVIELKRRAH